MQQRLGGLLSLTLGTVLLTGGTLGATGITVGGSSPSPTCGGVGPKSSECTTGLLIVGNYVTGNGPVVSDGGFTVTLTSSNCTVVGGDPVTNVLAFPIAAGSEFRVNDLYVSTGLPGSVSSNCMYSLAETPPPGYTGTFTPSPDFDFAGAATSEGPISVSVKLNNVGTPVTPSATPSVTPSATPVPTVTPTVLPTPSPAATPVGLGGGNGGGGALPFTGVQHLGVQLFAGGGLVLLGLFLLLAGRRTRRI